MFKIRSALSQETLISAGRAIAIVFGILCIHRQAFAQHDGSTMIHDFDGVGDLSSLRSNRASFELVDGGRVDHGQALRVLFDAVPEAQVPSPALVFEKNSLPNQDFSEIWALSFWVKNESYSGSYILISAQDRDGRQSTTGPDRVYISPGGWIQLVYRLEFQGLERKDIRSLHLFRKSKGAALSLLFDDFELLSPLAAQLVSLENQIRRSIENVQASAKQVGLEAFIESDIADLTQRFRNASSLVESERLPVLSLLNRDATNLARTIESPPKHLILRGPQVTNAWLAACASKITDAVQVSLYDTSITDAGIAQLGSLEHLEILSLSSPGITGSGLKGFASSRMKHLYFFAGSGINDAGLESIAAFRQLETIYFQRINVTNDGLRHLAGMKNLKSLTLLGSATTDEGLSHLRALTDLESLNLGSTAVTSLKQLGELKKLKHLDLSETRVDDAGLAGLGAFSKLETLILSKTDVLGPGLAGLKDAMQLSVLKLNDTRINDTALAGVIELPKLTRLEVSSTRITDATLVRIAQAKGIIYGPFVTGNDSQSERLTYLDIYGTNVTGDGIRHLGALTGLRELYAGGTGADDASVAALDGLGDLFHLDLQGTRVTDASLEHIGKFKNLNSLNLSGTAMKGANISKLSGIEELRTLNLAGTEISNETLDTIAQFLVRTVNADNGSGGGFAWLNRLILTDTNISGEGLKNIWRMKHLFALHLDGTKVGDEGLEHIALLPELQDLWLDGTIVSDAGLAALPNSNKLRTLSLKGTEITDDALSRIGAPIQELALSHTRISDAGVRTLASKEALQVLELEGTSVTDLGLESIARLPNLRVLNLRATPITDRGVSTLKTLPAINQVRLDRTTITDRAAESLALIATLGEVSLEGTRVTSDGKALLDRRRPDIGVRLDFPWADVKWEDREVSNEAPWSSSALPEDVTVADLKRLSSVRTLSLQHRNVDSETLLALRDLTNLESLDLADTSVDDSLLVNLIGLERLRALRLSRTEISDDGLQHLSGLQALEHLDLDGTRVTGAGLQHLKGLTQLRSIRLRETLLRDEHAAKLAALESLRKISATNTRLGDAGLRELEHLPALRYLDLFGTDVSDAGLKSIGRMSSLSHLYLSATAVTDLGLAALVGLEELVELGFDHCEITDRGLEHLTGFRHLERLRLNGTRVSDVGVTTISEITSLHRLELNNTPISNSSVEDLLKLTALKELNLNITRLSDRGLRELGSLSSLERLSVRETDVSPSGIEAFKARRPEVALTFEPTPSENTWAGVALSILYGLIAFAICLYGAHRYLLVWLFLRHRDVRSARAPASKFSELPPVTVQIPLFNERNVAERIITAACAMDYPRDRLQIQVLDDSTDSCTEIVLGCCERFQSKGINVTCHHRDAREGFKSGALAAGLETATGEFVAIFDADFVPAPDFLQRTVHHFTDEKVGVVQAEWRHLNRNESLLTQCQAMFLDGHLVLEQGNRSQGEMLK